MYTHIYIYIHVFGRSLPVERTPLGRFSKLEYLNMRKNPSRLIESRCWRTEPSPPFRWAPGIGYHKWSLEELGDYTATSWEIPWELNSSRLPGVIENVPRNRPQFMNRSNTKPGVRLRGDWWLREGIATYCQPFLGFWWFPSLSMLKVPTM